jgi:hypothetical protein
MPSENIENKQPVKQDAFRLIIEDVETGKIINDVVLQGNVPNPETWEKLPDILNGVLNNKKGELAKVTRDSILDNVFRLMIRMPDRKPDKSDN